MTNQHPMLNRKTHSKIALPEEDHESLIQTPTTPHPTDTSSIFRAFLSRVKLFHLVFWGLNILLLAFLLHDTPIVPNEPDILNGNFTSESCSNGKSKYQYALMLDAGSTGSRIHVYKFNNCHGPTPKIESEIFKQVEPGLSSYANDPNGAADSLKPLMEEAVRAIPSQLHSCTPVALKATAGLRLLGTEKSNAILSSVRQLLETYAFHVYSDSGVSVMDGAEEGVFAWVTVNYLLQTLGGSKVTALTMDLGGASTQIVFQPKNPTSVKNQENAHQLPFDGKTYYLYQNSYLGYGLMQGRRKIQIAASSNGSLPCYPSNQRVKITFNETWSTELIGTGGNFDTCTANITSIMFSKSAVCQIDPCSFDGIHQPPLNIEYPSIEGRKIFAFSYFYDRTFPLGLEKEFTVGDVRNLGEKVCSNDFSSFSSQAKNYADSEPFLCMDLGFIYSLLRTGYGLSDDRMLTVAKKIDGYEMGWCLGASLHMLDALHVKGFVCDKKI